MPLAGMAAGSSNALQELLVRAFQQKQAEQMMALRQQEMAQQQQAGDRAQQQLMLQAENQRGDEAFRQQQMARQVGQDDLAAADRRQGQNKLGVQRMIGDFVTQRPGPLDAGARQQISGMAVGEGIKLPEDLTTDPGQAQRDRIDLENLRNKNELSQIAAQGAQARQTVGARTATQPVASTTYSDRGERRLTTALDDLESKVNDSTVGTWGAMASRKVSGFTPGSVNPTVDFDALTEQVKALIGFDELNAMRRASPTGGALGQVSERELAYLQSVAGSLNPNQSQAQYKQQLQRIRSEVDRVVNYGLTGGGAPQPAHATPQQQVAPPSGGTKVGRFEIVSVK